MMIKQAVYGNLKLKFEIREDGAIVGNDKYLTEVASSSGNVYVSKLYEGKPMRTKMLLAAVMYETFKGESYNSKTKFFEFVDGNIQNCHIDNLKLKTRAKKEKPATILTPDTVTRILELLTDETENMNYNEVCKKLKVKPLDVRTLLFDKKYYPIRCGYNIKLAKEKFELWYKQSIH